MAAEIGADKNVPAMNNLLIDFAQKAMANEDTDADVKQSVLNLLPKDANMAEKVKIASENILKLKKDISKIYSRANASKKNLNSKLEVQRMAFSVFSWVYYEVKSFEIATPRALKLTQNITNLMMIKYSPHAYAVANCYDFEKLRYNDVINNYVLRYDNTLKSVLRARFRNNDIANFSELKKALLADKVLQGKISSNKRRDDLFDKAKLRESQLSCFAIKENYVVNENTAKAFKRLFECTLDNRSMDTVFKAEVSKLFKGIIKDERAVSPAVTNFYDNTSFDLENIYENLAVYAKHEATLDDMMNYVAKATFESCYSQLVKFNLDKEKHIELAQQLANIVVNTYSPVNFTKEVANEKYADFVTKDSALLNSTVEKLEAKHIEERKAIAEAIKRQEEAAAKKKRDEEEAKRKAEEAEVARKAAELEAKKNYKRAMEPLDVPEQITATFVANCMEELDKSIKDPKQTEAFKMQVAEILEECGLEKSKIQGSVDKIFAVVAEGNGSMMKIYSGRKSNIQQNGTSDPSSFMNTIMYRSVQEFSNHVINCFEGLVNLEKGVLASHKVLNVIFKNYSPVAFAKNKNFNYELNRFLTENGGNNYFNYYFDKFVNNTVKARYTDVYDFSAKVKEANKKSEPEKEKIAVDLIKAEAPKAEAPKVEAPKVEVNEPSKERIAVNEVLENVGGAQVSDKIKEHNAPVNSKAKE